MTRLQLLINQIDLALVAYDASELPRLGRTCLRAGCANSILTWLNPFYCSETCSADACGHGPDGWTTIGWTSAEALQFDDPPEADSVAWRRRCQSEADLATYITEWQVHTLPQLAAWLGGSDLVDDDTHQAATEQQPEPKPGRLRRLVDRIRR